MNNRLMRPFRRAIALLFALIEAINGDDLITQDGDKLRTIQNG